MSLRRFVCRAIGAVGACALTAAGSARAQVIERHAPLLPKAEPAPLATPDSLAADQDATVIGPMLRSIVVIGPGDAVQTGAVARGGATNGGIDVDTVARLRHDPRIKAQLARFIGRPLSRKLIAEIEAVLVRQYRALHYPFVAMSLPEQDISQGVLQVRVMEFVAGDIRVQGVAASQAAHIKAAIGLQPGQPIDDRNLIYDLDGLNRYPFRHVQPLFTPGQAVGTSDLVLTVTHQRPWQIYAGADTSGSRATGWARYFLGGAIGHVLGRDSVLAIQATGSGDAITHELHHPRYESLSATYSLPLSSRTLLEANADFVESNQASNEFFANRLDDVEGAVGIRIAIPALSLGSGISDVRLGVEARHVRNQTLFGGDSVLKARMSSYLAYFGVHHAQDGPHTHLDVDLTAHISPGGIDRENTSAQLALFSQNRVLRARYGYVTLDFNHTLALSKLLNWHVQAIGQVATDPLPRSEQAGLGGMSLVRGYSQDDGAYDETFILRNDVRLDMLPLKLNDSLAVVIIPEAFVDYGLGRDLAAHATRHLAAVGGGASATLNRNLSIRIDAARVLRPGPVTAEATNRIEASLSISY